MLEYLDVGSERLHETSTRTLVLADGLTGPPPVRGTWIDRPEEDGWIVPSFQHNAGRIIVLEGECWPGGNTPATDAAQINAAWAEWDLLAKVFKAAVATDTLVKWQHAGDTKQLQGTYRLAGEVLPTLSADENGPFIAYQATLRSADPRWVSQTLKSEVAGAPTVEGGMPLPVELPIPFGAGSSGGSISAQNAGNAIAWPSIVIQGPVTGPVVENVSQSKELRFDSLTLASGQTLTIEMDPAAPRSAKVAGASVFGSLKVASSEFFGITAESTETIRFFGAGTAMTVTWRDGYIS